MARLNKYIKKNLIICRVVTEKTVTEICYGQNKNHRLTGS